MNNKILKIDSRMAKEYYNDFGTSFLYEFNPIIADKNKSILYSVKSISIPYSFYACNEYNQNMDLLESGNTRSIVIPAGNYNAYQYAKALLALLNPSGSNITYELNYNSVTNKFLMSVSEQVTILYKTGPHTKKSNYKFFGFPADSDAILHAQSLIESPNCIVMSDINYLQIISDLDSNIVISGDNEDNILEIIPINVSPYGVIQHSSRNLVQYLYQQNLLHQFRIKLVDDSSRVINLNGLSFVITLKIEIVDNDEYKIPYSTRRAGEEEKTNLQIISEDPSIVMTAPQINMDEIVQYRRFMKEISKLSKSKKKKKNDH